MLKTDLCVFRSISSPPSIFCICPATMISSHLEENNQCIFVRECLRQNGLENSARYLKVIINFVYCMINVTLY